MNYQEAMKFITDTYKFGTKLGLDRIRKLLELLGNPHKELKYVHVAGTNGKGSVTAYLSTILMDAGYKTGIFISPYVQRFSERIRVDDNEITEEEITEYIYKIKEQIGVMSAQGLPHPTEFEILTTMAFMHYAKHNCDIVVLEVGMGGSIDSTNVIDDSLVSVITTISYDHQQYLGDALVEIAEKKAGIIKNYGKVVVYPQPDEIMAVFKEEARRKSAEVFPVLREQVKLLTADTYGQEFEFNGHVYKIGLLGAHQPYNAAVAIKAVSLLMDMELDIHKENIKRGLLNARWPARFEVVSREPMVVIDAAHNAEGAAALKSNLESYFPGRKFVFIVGVSKDKDCEAMFSPFAPLSEKFITVAADYYRAMPAQDLKAILDKFHNNVVSVGQVKEALDYCNTYHSGDIICAFGSLYYIGGVRDYFGLQ